MVLLLKIALLSRMTLLPKIALLFPVGPLPGAGATAPSSAAARPAPRRAEPTPTPSRTKWTRRVLLPVLIGHARAVTPPQPYFSYLDGNNCWAQAQRPCKATPPLVKRDPPWRMSRMGCWYGRGTRRGKVKRGGPTQSQVCPRVCPADSRAARRQGRAGSFVLESARLLMDAMLPQHHYLVFLEMQAQSPAHPPRTAPPLPRRRRAPAPVARTTPPPPLLRCSPCRGAATRTKWTRCSSY
jgi:hypothetical protein